MHWDIGEMDPDSPDRKNAGKSLEEETQKPPPDEDEKYSRAQLIGLWLLFLIGVVVGIWMTYTVFTP